jgi:phenylpyruvate tautomerase PptA (4-oxalocrotonate tautomerase family)
MPKLDLTISEGALSADAKAELPGQLGAAMLRAEGAPNTEFFRSITWVHLHELAARAVYDGDGVSEDPHAILDVTVPQGALDDRRRAGLVEEATGLLLDATGWGPEAGLRVWVIVHEVPEGHWGAGGQIVRFEELRARAKAEREAAKATA